MKHRKFADVTPCGLKGRLCLSCAARWSGNIRVPVPLLTNQFPAVTFTSRETRKNPLVLCNSEQNYIQCKKGTYSKDRDKVRISPFEVDNSLGRDHKMVTQDKFAIQYCSFGVRNNETKTNILKEPSPPTSGIVLKRRCPQREELQNYQPVSPKKPLTRFVNNLVWSRPCSVDNTQSDQPDADPKKKFRRSKIPST